MTSVYSYPTIQHPFNNTVFLMEETTHNNHSLYIIQYYRKGDVLQYEITHEKLLHLLSIQKAVVEQKIGFANGSKFIRLRLNI